MTEIPRPLRRDSTRPSLAPWLGWGVWAIMVALQSPGVVLLTRGHHVMTATRIAELMSAVAPMLAFGTVGAVIVSRRPHNTIGWLCVAVGLCQSIAIFGGQRMLAIHVVAPGRIPGGLVLYQLGGLARQLSWVALGLLLLLFPNGQPPSPAGGRSSGPLSPLPPARRSQPRSCRARSHPTWRPTRLGSNRLGARCGGPTQPRAWCWPRSCWPQSSRWWSASAGPRASNASS